MGRFSNCNNSPIPTDHFSNDGKLGLNDFGTGVPLETNFIFLPTSFEPIDSLEAFNEHSSVFVLDSELELSLSSHRAAFCLFVSLSVETFSSLLPVGPMESFDELLLLSKYKYLIII